MITRVTISGLDGKTVRRIDRLLGIDWRFDIRENGDDMFDVDVSNKCDVLYTSCDKAQNAIVLSVDEERVVSLKTTDFNCLIGG